MGNNSLFMEFPKNYIYIPYQRKNKTYVSSIEITYNINNNSNINNNNINYYTAKKIINNENLNKKVNNSTLEIVSNRNYNNNFSQCNKKNHRNIIRNINVYNNKINQEIFNKEVNKNIKIIHTKSLQTTTKSELNKKLNNSSLINSKNNSLFINNINYNKPITIYSDTSENIRNNSAKMKTPTSIITNLNIDNMNLNDTIISPTYLSPVYYTSSIPITTTSHTTTTTADINLNGNSLSSSNVTSLLNSCYCDEDQQYLVNDSNTITYIVNSNSGHSENAINIPSKSASLINKISTSVNASTINNNSKVKSLLPIEYYNNKYNQGRFLINSNEIVSPTITNNPNITQSTINDTQIISSAAVLSKSNTTSHINPIRSATEPNYTTLEQEKIRRPMMYSSTTNNNNVMNISPVITNIINNNSVTTDVTNNLQSTGNLSASSASSITSSSTISILSANSNLVLKDTKITNSPEPIHDRDAKAKQPKSQKKKSSTSLSDKSGIIGFAAEILTSVLPTSSNNLKHPKTRYLPELYPFIKKIARKCKIDIRTFLYALVYSQRFGEALLSHHKEAVGEYGTNHRIFLASILLAYQYQIDHGMKVNFKLDAKKLSKYTDGVWTEKEVEMMCKAFLSTKNFILDIDDDVVKEFVEVHKADLCWYS